MRTIFLIIFCAVFCVVTAQRDLDVEVILADSISFQKELIYLERHSSEAAPYNFDWCQKLLKGDTEKYPVLRIEMLRQLVSSGMKSKDRDALVFLLSQFKSASDSEIEKNAITLLEGIVASTFHSAGLSDLMPIIGLCDSLPSTPYHYDLVRRSFYRAYTRALEKESLYDEATSMAHSSLLLNLPEPYSLAGYYDEYLIARHFFKGDNQESAMKKFERVIELIPPNPGKPARNIRARSLHYIGICSEKRGDEETYMRFTKMAVDSMLQLNSRDAIPPMLDVADYLVNKRRFAEADVLFSQVDSLHSCYESNDYIDGAILFSRYRYARATGFVEEAIGLAVEAEKKAQNTMLIEIVATELIAMLAETGRYEAAFNYQKKHIDVLTRKRDVNALREIEQRRHLYEHQKQEDAKATLLAEQLQQLEVITMQDQLLIAAISAILILLVTALYIAYVSKKLKGANDRLQFQTVALREAKNLAEKAGQVKADFLSVMSHEIRTPLNAIIGLNKELIKNEPREDQRENLKHVDESSNHLLALINDILDHNKLDAQKIKLEKKPLELAALMDQLVKMANILKGEKEVVIKSAIDMKLPELILGDPLRVTQICNNLCMNAVKFTSEGAISIRFNLADNNQFEIQVEDTGIGIEPEDLEKIFLEFTQAERDTARLYGGSGLGLSITKRLTILMKGEIKVTSVVDEGSIFSVFLPLEEAFHTEENPTDSDGFVGNIKILVAEDNELNKLVVQSILNRWGVVYAVVSNGKEAVERLEEEDFDIVLMDVQMPVMDGLQATRLIRGNENPKIANLPVIALTASSQPEEIAQMKQAGMDELILKPIDSESLKKVMLILLTK